MDGLSRKLWILKAFGERKNKSILTQNGQENNFNHQRENPELCLATVQTKNQKTNT